MHNQTILRHSTIMVILGLLLGILFFPVIADCTFSRQEISQIPIQGAYLDYLPSEDDKVTILIQQQGLAGNHKKNIEVPSHKAKQVLQSLRELEGFIINENWEKAVQITSKLQQEDILSDDFIDSLIHLFQTVLTPHLFDEQSFLGNSVNLFCLILGNGNGFFSFPFDTALSFFLIWVIVFISILTGDFIDFVSALLLGPIYSIIVSHVFPRFILPSVPFYLESGAVKTFGLKGAKTLEENSSYHLYGFTGLIINVVPSLDDLLDPQDPFFFCIGTTFLILPAQ